MAKAKNLILSILCGLPADSKPVQDALADAGTAEELLRTTRITKADFLRPLADNDSLFAYEQTWQRLPQIAAMLRAQGEEFTAADFKTAVAEGATAPVRYAEKLRAYEHLLAAEVWNGRLREATDVFYAIGEGDRKDLNLTEMRNKVAAIKGDLTPEARLTLYGLQATTVRTNIRQGNLTDLKKKLDENGDRITKEYVFLLDSAGDHVFEFKDTFDNINSWLGDLEAQGDRLTKADFLYAVGGRKNALDYAVQHDKLNCVFTSRIWRGHATEMMELFGKLPEAERAKVKIELVLGQIKEEEYGSRITIDRNVTVNGLTAILNDAERGSAGYYPIQPLGFLRVWERMAEIREALAAKGQHLTLGHLRAQAGPTGESIMAMAARTGHFDQVVAIARTSGEKLTFDELTAAEEGQKSILDILCEKDQAAQLFVADMWVGRGRELMALWEKVPSGKRDGIDFEAVCGHVNMLTLRRQFGGPRLG